MRTEEPRAVHLKDYRAPDYHIGEVALDFALDPAATIVKATLKVTRTGAANPLAAEPTVATDPAEAQTGHEFGHQDSEPIVEEHEFAHHAPEAAVEHDVTSDASESPAEHEFAYETSQPADKPADPLS